jgi:hypothetical protein
VRRVLGRKRVGDGDEADTERILGLGGDADGVAWIGRLVGCVREVYGFAENCGGERNVKEPLG